MVTLSVNKLKDYLLKLHGEEAEIVYIGEIGKATETEKHLDIKGFGYGKPYLVEYRVGGRRHSVVLQTMKADSFGHEFPGDRAQSLILAHQTYNKLPHHVRTVDLGVFTRKSEMVSIGDFEEFFLLVEKVEGKEYFWDLNEIAKRGRLTSLDIDRCQALASYLATIHRVKLNAPNLYRRRIRELIGHGECIMGLIDNYPDKLDFVDAGFFREFEKLCIDWRWRLRGKEHRLSQVHGDFHPWNILFREGMDFTVLDRSRGEWGEPADDFSCMTINYIFYCLQSCEEWRGPFKELFKNFIETYIRETGDEEIFEVVQPFYAWRALVLASPIWYPTLSAEVRRRILKFALNMLKSSFFEWKNVELYLEF